MSNTKTFTQAEIHTLIAACQKVSAMAPKPRADGWTPNDILDGGGPPDSEGFLDPDQVEALCYDSGLFHTAEIVRSALREIGVEPAEGTSEWYHEETADA